MVYFVNLMVDFIVYRVDNRLMRTYGQHCGLAEALDLVGDRWTLLILRELLIRERCRYTDIKAALPRIATNLLASRLRELERHDLLAREDDPPPVATALYRLTPLGLALEPAILALGQWGARHLAPADKAVMQPHWLVLPLKIFVRDADPAQSRASIELQTGGEKIALSVGGGRHTVRLGAAENPAATVAAKPKVILKLFSGGMSLAAAKAAGLRIDGNADVLRRMLPKTA